MKGFVQNIEGITVKNEEFRRVLYTARNCQLVVMALKPKEEIGMVLSTIPASMRKRTTNTSTVKLRNRESSGHRGDCPH